MFNYRKFYFDTLEIEDKPDYDIHHLDFDRKNNDISNLVMIDSKLHHKYHMCLTALGAYNCQFDTMHRYVQIDLVYPYTEYHLTMLKHLADAMIELRKAVSARDQQLLSRQMEDN